MEGNGNFGVIAGMECSLSRFRRAIIPVWGIRVAYRDNDYPRDRATFDYYGRLPNSMDTESEAPSQHFAHSSSDPAAPWERTLAFKSLVVQFKTHSR